MPIVQGDTIEAAAKNLGHVDAIGVLVVSPNDRGPLWATAARMEVLSPRPGGQAAGSS